MAFDFLNSYANDAPVVFRNGAAVAASVFCADAASLRTALPDARYVINLCEDRYAFLTTFAAALSNRQITLLPASSTEAALARLCEQHESVIAVVDGTPPGLPVPAIIWESALEADGAEAGLSFDPDQPAAVVHTSGSTGEPRPHIKTWGMLVRRSRCVGARLGLDAIRKVVATVPSQHMYGLENAIMLPLQHGITIDAARPLFPADVTAALDASSLLVTTPVHLKALNQASPEGVRAGMILSSTAPLPADQARSAEVRFEAPVLEIYGSTETGVVATRRPNETRRWRLLDTLRLRRRKNGMLVEDRESGIATELHDEIEMADDGTFVLGQREQDIIKVAGKRASLAALNEALCSLPGVRDGAFLAPDEEGEFADRPAALVVAPDASRDELLARLRKVIDPAFMPRPFVMVESLPRNATGKLPWEAARDLRNRALAADR